MQAFCVFRRRKKRNPLGAAAPKGKILMMADGKQEAILRAVRALSVTFGDSSPKGGALGRPGNFPLDA